MAVYWKQIKKKNYKPKKMPEINASFDSAISSTTF